MSAIFLFALSGRGRVVHVARFHQRITMALENLGWQYLGPTAILTLGIAGVVTVSVESEPKLWITGRV